MRNLKRFLAVLVVVAVMATSMIPAFAADAELSPIEVVTGLGIVEGAGNGVDDEYLAADTTKIQAAVILLKALGLYEEAIDFDGEENFADADEVTWAAGRRILAYLKAHPELGWVGNPDGTFDAYAVIEPAQLYKVMLELLGYEQNVDFKWSEVLEKAVEFGMAGEYVDGEGVTNEDMIGIIYEALYTPVKGGTEEDVLLVYLAEINEAIKEKAIELGLIVVEEEPGELTATVAATGAKKLTVTFNQPVDSSKAVFTVKRGAVKPSVKSITFSEDKTSAVIEFNVNLADGDYTVEIAGLTEEAIVLTTKVEAAKLTTIEFRSDIAVISDVYASKSVKVGVVGKNQYGEEVPGFNPAVFASKGTGSVASGVLTLTVTSGSYTVGEKIVVTLVDSTTNTTKTETLTVAQAAQVSSVTVGELKTDDKDLAAKPINVSNLNSNLSKYYIPVEIKDQYGNVLKKAELAGVDIISSNTEIINPKGFKDLDNGTTVIELQATTSSAKAGTVVLTVVASGTGKTGNTTITVLEDAKIDTVVLSAPETELKIGKAAVLPITVIDTYGNEVALKDITFTAKDGETISSTTELKLNGNTKLSVTGAKLAVKTNYITGVTTVEITPDPGSKNIIVTVTTATAKFQSLTLVAVDAPVPTSIKGMKSDFVTMLADVDTMKTEFYSKVELLDQYGDTFEDTMPTGYSYIVTPKDTPAYTTYVSGYVYAQGEDKVGTDVYVVKLMKDSTVLDEMEVAVTVVDKEKITAFGIDDLNKFYTGDTTGTYTQTVKIHGLVDGKKVAVPQDMIKLVTANNGLPIETNGEFTATTDVDTDGKDINATITVWVEAGSNTYTLTKDVVYSSAAPKASSLVIKKGGDEVTNAVEVTLASGNLFTGIDGLKVEAKDQYGHTKTTDAKFAITNNETGLTLSVNDSGDLTVSTGTVDPGKSFTLTVFMDGLYKSVKVYVK
ncbi:hypothetical protein CDQ84_15630 [Clostridium thermosuccinogenes]|uniref:SLH domain-containing protein n=1 Tax=Clostridium thermosuccinogenes TaxID=84032 RepID=A0A2K2FBR0_9CLOT|nr:hypothetical protein [Pseudoclostridium thermosuccinogenes]AUS98517.1 hypothetical protein CDO33_19910 [Pseudoclostridium thermosuccinogenes]PNT95308.1 hypothetical protein CDQ85_15345 [Pseudoclostridium thermosuccinogenes]PNT96220.1 hypothetical protein CDQ84_15630 [Pseudoclostridium thermosuccinogenes]